MLLLQDPVAAVPLLDLLPEGVSVTAVVVTVILFLRSSRSMEDRLQRMSDRCHEVQLQLQESYRASLADLTALFSTEMRDLHAAVRDLHRTIKDQTKP